uniref:Uncharacterized protein n=1 Tax=Myoviridae sp. ctNQV2 TaxID=2827683 RepID=A0A8S5RYC2_9CAUD|nr:MAG TPA: hypothetical protein [Myoviridae sp. ctNQV2]
MQGRIICNIYKKYYINFNFLDFKPSTHIVIRIRSIVLRIRIRNTAIRIRIVIRAKEDTRAQLIIPTLSISYAIAKRLTLTLIFYLLFFINNNYQLLYKSITY